MLKVTEIPLDFVLTILMSDIRAFDVRMTISDVGYRTDDGYQIDDGLGDDYQYRVIFILFFFGNS